MTDWRTLLHEVAREHGRDEIDGVIYKLYEKTRFCMA